MPFATSNIIFLEFQSCDSTGLDATSRRDRERERENETALRSTLFLEELSSASHAAPREKTNEGSAHLVRLYNGKYDKWGVSFPTFLTEIFLFCVPEPTLSPSRVDTQKEEHAPEEDWTLDSFFGFFGPAFSRFFCVVTFFSHVRTLSKARARTDAGTRLVAAPPKKKKKKKKKKRTPDGPRTKTTTTTTTAAAAMRDIKALKIEVAPSEKNEGNDLGGPLVVSLRTAPTTLTDGTYAFNLFRGNPDTSDRELEKEFGNDAYERAYNFTNGKLGNGDTPHSERHLVVVGRGDGCDVIGKNFAHEKCGFGIGVLPKDATQGVMAHEDGRSMDVLGRLVPVGKEGSGEYVLKLQRLCGDSVVHMLTRPQRLNYQFNRDDVEKLDYDDINVRRAITADATKLFSSQKRQRQQAKLMSARKLDSDAIASPKLLESQIGKSSRFAMTRKDLMQKAGEQRNLPPHDLEATKPHEAFPWKLTPGYVLFSHNLPYNDFIKAGKKTTVEAMIESLGGSEKPKAIIDLLPMIHVTDPNWAISAGDHSFDATEKAKALAFMDALLQFASLKSGRVKETRPKRIEMKKRKRKEEGEEGVKKEEDGEKEEEEEEEIEIIEEEVKHKWLFTKPERVDPLIQQCIIDTFTEVEVGDGTQYGESRLRTKRLKDLLVLHIILLALRVSNWQVDSEPLRAALKLKTTEFTPMYKQLGASKVTSIKHKKDESPTIALMMAERQLSTILPEIKNRVQAKKKKES